MSFEELDKNIKEAANMHQPAFNEKAWDKMQHLLDIHLPEKEKKRNRFIWILLFLCLVGIGLFSVIYWPATNVTKGEPVSMGNKKTENKTNIKNEPLKRFDINNLPQETITNNDKEGKSAFVDTGKSIQHSIGTLTKKQPANENTEKLLEQGNDKKNQSTPKNNNVAFPSASDKSLARNIREETHSPETIITKNNTGQISANPDSILEVDINRIKNEVSLADTLVIDSTHTNKNLPAIKKHINFANRFAITISAGPSVSMVKTGPSGKITIAYGAGLLYQVSKKISVSSGFFISDKIYTAQPADYHPPAGYWTYNYNLTKVEADCRIFEWPVTFNYTITENRKHAFLVSAGVSSYFMKRETYNYFYKDQAGVLRNRSWTNKNKIENLFSVVSIAGGYQYKFNNQTSLFIQPQIKIPVTGIGFGKIKLNDAGTLFTLQIKPFAKKQ